MTDIMAPDGYDDEQKETSWRAFLRAWDVNNRGDVDLGKVHIKTARTNFERWWRMNYE